MHRPHAAFAPASSLRPQLPMRVHSVSISPLQTARPIPLAAPAAGLAAAPKPVAAQPAGQCAGCSLFLKMFNQSSRIPWPLESLDSGLLQVSSLLALAAALAPGAPGPCTPPQLTYIALADPTSVALRQCQWHLQPEPSSAGWGPACGALQARESTGQVARRMLTLFEARICRWCRLRGLGKLNWQAPRPLKYLASPASPALSMCTRN